MCTHSLPSSLRPSSSFPVDAFTYLESLTEYIFSLLNNRALLMCDTKKGRYLPVFASEIFDQNQISAAEGRQIINMTSVLIGNGNTDISTYACSFVRRLSSRLCPLF